MWTAILVVAVILFVVALVSYWWTRKDASTPSYVWGLFSFSILLVLVAMIISSYSEPESNW